MQTSGKLQHFCLHNTLFSKVFWLKYLLTALLVCTKNRFFPLLPLLNMSAGMLLLLTWPGTTFSSENMMKNKLGQMPKYVGLIDLFNSNVLYQTVPLSFCRQVCDFLSDLLHAFGSLTVNLTICMNVCLWIRPPAVCLSVTATSISLCSRSHSCDYSFVSAGVISALLEAKPCSLDLFLNWTVQMQCIAGIVSHKENHIN